LEKEGDSVDSLVGKIYFLIPIILLISKTFDYFSWAVALKMLKSRSITTTGETLPRPAAGRAHGRWPPEQKHANSMSQTAGVTLSVNTSEQMQKMKAGRLDQSSKR
jgi:hypothetical protein